MTVFERTASSQAVDASGENAVSPKTVQLLLLNCFYAYDGS